MTGFESLITISLKSISIYLFIVLAIRFFGKKELAQLSVVDLVFILLISNSVQNAMVGDNTTLGGGVAAALGLFIINYVFKLLLRKFPWFSRAIQGTELMLIYKGKIQQQNFERSMLTMEELEATIREHGVNGVADVDLAILEVDGNISVCSKNFGKKTSHVHRGHKVISRNP
ncbi:MAG: transrane protein YrbG [Bacteroidota bacterium]|nr:transrane protein YrbG [Bacteroidota bacterium]